MALTLAFITICLLVCSYGHDHEDSKSVKYSGDSFNLGLATNNHFVMFYAPWLVGLHSILCANVLNIYGLYLNNFNMSRNTILNICYMEVWCHYLTFL